MAVWRLGGATSSGDPDLKAKYIKNQVEQLKCNFVVCVEDSQNEVKKALKGFENIKLFSLDNVDGTVDLLKETELVEEVPDAVDVDDKEELVHVFWSSGTTGIPKGICHSHKAFWNSVGNGFIPSSHTFFTSCFFHLVGCMSNISNLMFGFEGTFLSGKGFNLQLILARTKQLQPTCLALGSHHYVQLSEVEVENFGYHPAQDFNCVKRLCPIGSAIPTTIIERMSKMFPNSINAITYGQTEVGVMVVGTHLGTHLGLVKAGVQLKIVNVNTSNVCKPFETGEILAKSPTIMTGYLNKPKEDFFEPDGFGRSGDLAFYDENTNIFYVDRIKELIKYKNHYRISPSEIEMIACQHTCVAECLAFAIDEPSEQEYVSLAVVCVEGAKVKKKPP